mgnify:CR=1 FL=1
MPGSDDKNASFAPNFRSEPEGGPGVGGQAENQIQVRKSQIPAMFQGVYLKALGGSKAAAVKAFCLECCGWKPKEVRACSAHACPMHAVRPFQAAGVDEEEVDEEEVGDG